MGDSWGSFGSWDSWWSGYGSDSWGSYDSWDSWGSYGSWDSYGPSYWSSYGPSYWSSGSYGSDSWDMWGSGSPSYWSSSYEDSAWFKHGAEKRSLAANMKHAGKTNMAEKQMAHFREMSEKALNWLTLHPFNGVPQAQLNWGRAQRKNKAEAALKKKNLKAKLGARKHQAEARKHQAEARKHQTEAKKHQARSA